MSDSEEWTSTPLVIADLKARTITLHIREGFGNGSDPDGLPYLKASAEMDGMMDCVREAILNVMAGKTYTVRTLIGPASLRRQIADHARCGLK